MKEYSDSSKKNERYMKMMGGQSGKVMKNHGNTKPIKGDVQKYDMGRLQPLRMEKKGYNEKAFDYQY